MTPWLLPLLAAPFVGSFLGVLVRRLPENQPVAWARSRCEHCGHVLTPVELIPLVSYWRQHGRCRACGQQIPPAHLWIELAATAVAATAALVDPDPAPLWADCALGWTLLALAWIDWTHLRLPDVLTLPLVLAGLAEAAWLAPYDLPNRAIAAAIGYVSLRLLAVGYRMLRGRDGLGAGDAKMLAAAGAWVGVAGLGPTVLAAALTGFAVAGLRGGFRATTVIPFGACLAAGTWAVRLLG